MIKRWRAWRVRRVGLAGRWWLRFFVWSLLALALVWLLLMQVVPRFLSLPDGLSQRPPTGLQVLDREGHVLRRLLDGDLRADAPADFEEIPSVLVQATLAAEDARFFSHHGIDTIGLLRAVSEALRHGHFVSGASTITQQTAKLYSPPRPRTLRTKAIEILLARRIELSMDKPSILAAYLNRLPYGNQFTGPRAAARGYFGKPLSDLSVGEAALLAGLPNKPSRYNPWRNYEGAMRRQKWILRRMAKEGYLSETDLAAALTNEPKLIKGGVHTWHAPHFAQMLLEREPEAIAAAREAGTPLRTTLDLALQHFVESSIATELSRLTHLTKEEAGLQAAVVVLENQTGEILALSGSRSFFQAPAGQINGTWRPRSAGSTLKPFTYVLALQNGANPATVLADTPIEYITPTGVYQPVNFDRRFHGPVSLRYALANSLNVPAVKTLESLGGVERLYSCLVDDLHFTSLAPKATEYGLGLTIGNAEVRLLELANGFASLARMGVWKPYRFLPSSPAEDEDHRVFSSDACWLIADILSDEAARAPSFGTQSPLNLPFQAAVKTGTSTDFRDSWAVGYTPDYTVGVWVGRFDNKPLRQVTGAIGAGPIYHAVMEHLYRQREATWYPAPTGLVEATVDKFSGKRVSKELAEQLHLLENRLTKQRFLPTRVPPSAEANDYDEQGRTRLPIAYSNWWRAKDNPLQKETFLETIAEDEAPRPFRIISPLDGTLAYLDPDLPKDGSRFPLRIAGTGKEEIAWHSPTLSIETTKDEVWLILQPGEHEVTATDKKTGRSVQSHIRVEAL